MPLGLVLRLFKFGTLSLVRALRKELDELKEKFDLGHPMDIYSKGLTLKEVDALIMKRLNEALRKKSCFREYGDTSPGETGKIRGALVFNHLWKRFKLAKSAP